MDNNSQPAGTTARFFRRLDWAAFWTATLAAFAVYAYTLAPTVTLEDSGELAVAADSLGVPHPPGYPIWTMLSWLFTRVFAFVTFRGQPNPAWSVGLMSAVFGALAAGITAMLICRSGSEMLRESLHRLHETGRRTADLICWAAGVSCSLLFAFSPVMWSQSTIVEVYSLNAFFLVWIFLLTYQWMLRSSDRLLIVMAFIFGLGLTNYQVLLLAALPLAFAVFLRDIRLFRDFLILGLPYLLVIGGIKQGVLPAISHPTDATGITYMLLNVAAIGLAWWLLPRGRTVALTFLMAELGLAFYAYMPIVSDLRNPPMNWGYPRTWEGFQHAISRGQYERIQPADVFSLGFVHQIGDYLSDLRGQFTLPVALLGFLPFTAWEIRVGRRRLRAMYAAIVLAVAATLVVALERVAGPGTAQALHAARLDKVLIAGILFLMFFGGGGLFVAQLDELVQRARGRDPGARGDRIAALLALAGLATAYLGYVAMLASRVVRVLAPLRGTADLETAQIGAILLAAAQLVLLIVLPALLAAMLYALMRSRAGFRLSLDPHSQKWIIATLLGFLAMSIMLIALANPKGDIQDTFIQRVKFISSHALYAFWIGYGLIFGLAFLDSVFRESPLVKWAGLLTAGLLPLIPIHENYFNRELERVSGGAEQNGHDFGWQFGNYQLRGAEAIREEVGPDEEPLPNPAYPPAMGPRAVFFGGTDPGRFVPTYMIYGARVREDVYLITQNALADNTYMSVMRDLYGDQIWIPAQPDSARSFQRYVEEVNSGKRPRNADLRIENGRVQVSGALGVMEINGILAQMIFEHNSWRHDFYVEESYVIPWMYPYLTPHGLIMKINAAPTALDPSVTQADMDFWDWYARRLMDNVRFRRDVVARKSFSKLRSAIAGLYASRGMLGEAETAFQQARTLYPLSPEANFRLAQEVLMRQRRYRDTRWLIDDFARRDPRNSKADDFRAHLDGIENTFALIAEREQLMRENKLDIPKAIELAQLYTRVGYRDQFVQLMRNIAAMPQLHPLFRYRVAQLYAEAGMLDDMTTALDRMLENLPGDTPPDALLGAARLYAQARDATRTLKALDLYLAKAPRDWRAWIDRAVMEIEQGRQEECLRALQRAVTYGGQEARTIIDQDARLTPVRRRLAEQTRHLMQIPGVLGTDR